MKKRLTFILITIGLLFLFTPVIFVFFKTQGRSRYGAFVLIALFYLAIYAYYGLSKTIVYLIYGLITFSLLVIFTKYELPFLLIGTLMMIINPLEQFEMYLNKQLNENQFVPINLTGFAKYNTYNLYRKDMKSTFHLPQVRKLFTNPKYKRMRQATFVVITGITLFVFISQINTMIQTLDEFKLTSFLSSSYAITVLIIINMLLYRKGFTSAIRGAIVLIFPPIMAMISMSTLTLIPKIVLNSLVNLMFIAVIVREIIFYYTRIVYESYTYYDHEIQAEVQANALFEPYAYNEYYIEEYVFELNLTQKQFEKIKQRILIYANYYKFFIVAFTFKENQVSIYVHMKSSQFKRSMKFVTYLESLVNDKITYKTFYDPGKVRYEKTFFHKDDFIIARTKYLLDVLKSLEIRNQLIVNLFVYFAKDSDLQGFTQKYNVIRLHEYDYESNRSVLVQLEIPNSEYLVELEVRSFLLNLLIYGGKFVRVSVEYKS